MNGKLKKTIDIILNVNIFFMKKKNHESYSVNHKSLILWTNTYFTACNRSWNTADISIKKWKKEVLNSKTQNQQNFVTFETHLSVLYPIVS